MRYYGGEPSPTDTLEICYSWAQSRLLHFIDFFKVLTDLLHQLRRRYLHAELITLPALDLGSSLSLSLSLLSSPFEQGVETKKFLNQFSQSISQSSKSTCQSVNKSRIFTSLFWMIILTYIEQHVTDNDPEHEPINLICTPRNHLSSDIIIKLEMQRQSRFCCFVLQIEHEPRRMYTND